MNNCVYKFINRDGELIYIGKAKNLKNRLSNHNHLTDDCYKELAYIMYASFDTEHEMDFAERYYIQKLTPKYNTILSDKPISFDCDELDEKIFDIYELNQYVIEKSFEQMKQLEKEKLNINFDFNILEVIGLIYTILSSYWDDIRNKRCDISVRKHIKYMHENTFTCLKNINIELSKKYNLLNIKIVPYNFLEQKDYIKGADFKENTIKFQLLYSEKYKNKNMIKYKSKEIIIKCK